LSFTENFDTTLGNYSNGGTSAAWDGTEGYFAAGCAKLPAAFSPPLIQNTTDTHSIVSGNKIYFYYRILGCDDLPDAVNILQMVFGFSGASSLTPVIEGVDVDVADTGWILYEQSLAGYEGDTLDLVHFENAIFTPTYGSTGRFVYIDTVKVGNTPPDPPVSYGYTRSAGGIPGSVMVS
jgi:hypothetical protein